MPGARDLVRQAESRLARRYGIRMRSSTVELADPPIDVRVLEADVDGDRTGREGTTASDDPPVLFLHEAGQIASQWMPLWASLPGRRLIGVDLPGFGLSMEVDHRALDLRALATGLVTCVLDQLDLGDVPVVGNGLGGAFGLWAALDTPDRVRSLVLLGAPGPAAPGAKVTLPLAVLGVRPLNRVILDLPLPPMRVNRAMYAWALGRDAVRDCPEEIVEVGHHAMDRPTFASSMTSFMESAYWFFRPRRHLRLRPEELAEVDRPTLLVWGERERFGRVSAGRSLAEALPAARLEVIDAGHAPWLQHPRRCAELVTAFLDEREEAR